MDQFKRLSSDLLKEDEVFLPTFNEKLDSTLGGGFPVGCLSEVHGQSGVGKTQLCLQLCANVQLPSVIGGLDGQCIFLDCNGGFSVSRLQQICQPTKEVALRILRDTAQDAKTIDNFNAKEFTDGVIYKRVNSIDDLLSSLDDLVAHLLPTHSRIRLLVIDSIAFHFRYPLSNDVPNVTATLHNVAQKLNAITQKWQLVTIVTNQMTTQLPKPGEIGDGELIPALGESWSHACSTSVSLCFATIDNEKTSLDEGGSRQSEKTICLVKSSRTLSGAEGTRFFITQEGIRDSVMTEKITP